MEASIRFEFLEDAAAYRAMQAMWQSIFDRILGIHNLSHRPYLKSDYREGELFSNGNPIFTGFVDAVNRGVRIIQDNQVEDVAQFISGWLDKIEDYDGLPNFDELVIPIVLSEETKKIAAEWIQAWLVKCVDKETMKQLLEEQAILVAE